MKQKKDKSDWLSVLLSFAAKSKWKMILSMFCSLISVMGGFLPYVCLYKIMQLFIFGSPTVLVFLFWCGIAMLGYFLYVVFFGLSTVLSHSAAYHILYDLRMAIADRLMKVPLGNVTGSAIGHLKNIMVEKVEGIERPLAHMIPELGANIVLALIVFIYLFVIDWRMGLASMVTLPFAAIPMIVSGKGFNEKYSAYMAANDHVNSVIVEYVSGIEVVKTFNQTTSSYEKFSEAIRAFQRFTFALLSASQKKELAQFVRDYEAGNIPADVPCTTLLRGQYFIPPQADQPLTEIREGDLYFCLEQRLVTVRGQVIPLTVKEFDIFSLLIQHPGRVYSYEVILDLVWQEDYNYYSRKAVNNHISNLRRKIKVAPDVPDYVKSVYGIGYKFEI